MLSRQVPCLQHPPSAVIEEMGQVRRPHTVLWADMPTGSCKAVSAGAGSNLSFSRNIEELENQSLTLPTSSCVALSSGEPRQPISITEWLQNPLGSCR